MAIRFANEDDVDQLVEYWINTDLHNVYRSLSFNADKLRNTFNKIIKDQSKAYCLFVSDDEAGKAHGYLVGQIDSFYFSDDIVAKVIFYWVHPNARYTMSAVKLLASFKQWSKNRKATQIIMGITSQEHLAATDKMMKKMGAQFVGGNYVFEI